MSLPYLQGILEIMFENVMQKAEEIVKIKKVVVGLYSCCTGSWLAGGGVVIGAGGGLSLPNDPDWIPVVVGGVVIMAGEPVLVGGEVVLVAREPLLAGGGAAYLIIRLNFELIGFFQPTAGSMYSW